MAGESPERNLAREARGPVGAGQTGTAGHGIWSCGGSQYAQFSLAARDAAAIKAGVITAETRFGLHATKHRGVTDTPGTRRDKQDAAGHRSPTMTDVYNHALDVYAPAGNVSKRPG